MQHKAVKSPSHMIDETLNILHWLQFQLPPFPVEFLAVETKLFYTLGSTNYVSLVQNFGSGTPQSLIELSDFFHIH